MASKIAGVTVLEGGRVKWGTIGGLLVGVPAYAYTVGMSRFVDLVFAALEWLLLGPVSFVARLVDVAFWDALRGIWRSNYSFTQAIEGAGVLAPVFAAGGTFLVAAALYYGVSKVNG